MATAWANDIIRYLLAIRQKEDYATIGTCQR